MRSRILDTIQDGIYVVNQSFGIEYANPVLERDFGPSRGQPCYAYLHGRAEPCPRCLNGSCVPGQTDIWEWHSEITERTYELFATPLRRPDGSFAMLEIFHDITRRKNTETLLERVNNELQMVSTSEHKQRELAEDLREASLALTRSLDLDTILDRLLTSIHKLVDFDSAQVLFITGEMHIEISAMQGNRGPGCLEQVGDIFHNIQTDPILGEILLTQQSLNIPETRDQPGWPPLPCMQAARSWLGIPLFSSGQVIGICTLEKEQPGFFTPEHQRLAEIMASQACVAIQNAWLFKQVSAGRERLHSLSRRLVEIQENERRYIARELHDEAGQALSSIMLGLHRLELTFQDETKLTTNDVAYFHINEQIQVLEQQTVKVLDELRRLAMSLRPACLDHLGLVAALEQLVQDMGERSGICAKFGTTGLQRVDRLQMNIETTLYRIVQEALTNVIRHANASCVDVVLSRFEEKIVLVIEDDGVGFETEGKEKCNGHLGLLGMQERAEMLNGKFTIESHPGSGTTLVVEVPYGVSG